MDPGEEGNVQRDAQPGISAVLAAHADSTDLEGDVLDLAAVLDGLVVRQFRDHRRRGRRHRHRSPSRWPTCALATPICRCACSRATHAGQAAAWAAGFDAAAYDLILVTTADGQFEVRESNHLLDAIEHGADLAIGYRARRADSFVRRVQGWGWNVLVRLLFGTTGRDVDCPVRLFRKAVWQRLAMHPRQPTPIFNAEFLVRARRMKFQVAEVPLTIASHGRLARQVRRAWPRWGGPSSSWSTCGAR